MIPVEDLILPDPTVQGSDAAEPPSAIVRKGVPRGDGKKLSPNTIKKFPKTVTERHEIAFEKYRSLGRTRTYQAVASWLDVSLTTVQTWAQAGKWKERIAEDLQNAKRLGIVEVMGKVGLFRKDGIEVVGTIMTWLKRMTEIIEIHRKEKRELDAEEKSELEALKDGLKNFGVSFKSPRDLKDLVGAINELVDFRGIPGALQMGEGEEPPRAPPAGISVEGPALIIVGLGSDNAMQTLPMKSIEDAVREKVGPVAKM